MIDGLNTNFEICQLNNGERAKQFLEWKLSYTEEFMILHTITYL